MNLANKQIIFRKPTQVSAGLNEGIRALAENYDGSIQAATDHCVLRVEGLTESKLTRSRAKNPPGYTRDGQSLITLVWVLLVDGLLPHRPQQVVYEWFVNMIDATDLFENKLTETELPTLIATFVESLDFAEGADIPTSEAVTRTLTQVWAAKQAAIDGSARLMPLLNRLFIGREADVESIHQRIGVGDRTRYHPLTIVQGWPGVGKTALVNTIIHGEQIKNTFADDVLWASLGRNGNVFTLFKDWAQQLGAFHLLQLGQLTDLLNGLRMVLKGRSIFILVDDIWTSEQGLYVKNVVDLTANTVLLTTRFKDVAKQLADVPSDIYVLEVLSEAHAIELLSLLAPEPVRIHQQRMPQLVGVLEGLPLALRVAGPTLQHYHDLNFDIDALLDEFENDYNRLLESTAPSDRFDEETGQTPTIELLLKRSVETLSPETQLAFAALGVFKHKPATFDTAALQSVWEADDPKILIEILIGRGLMEVTQDRRYHVHQTLHMYANKMLDDLDHDQSG